MAPRRSFVVRAETDPSGSHVVARNGTFPISAIEARSVGAFAYIEGIGSRGRAIRGGFAVTAEAMDRLAHQWLRERVRR